MKWLIFSSISVLFFACGGDERPSRYPAREPGCAVQIFYGAPQGRTVNIGPVSASCTEDVSDTDCLRTLQDQACKLGGDVVWGVDEKPKMDLGHKKFNGRAAHTRDSSPASSSSGGASWSSSVTVIDGGM
ncbi:MAG: hypothetical protein ACRELY_10560 [Polyangiaceae bacterium]